MAGGDFHRAQLHSSNREMQWDLMKVPLTIPLPSSSLSAVVESL